ncbi:MAG: glycoside hydrolase family 2 TIM barrel-domain containing protein [Ferruginibacter sp.]
MNIIKPLTLTLIGHLLITLCCAQINYKPIKTVLKKEHNAWQFIRNGSPYFVKGAGGSGHLKELVSCGGNSIRTWGSDDGIQVLNSAQKFGLTVLMGLEVTAERHGFNYDDSTAVKTQFYQVKAAVLKLKDHPALLAWGIGNELNLDYKNPKVWNAVNDIAVMIHELDPNHPVTTVLAGINKPEVDFIKALCTQIDFLSVNTYGGLASLPKEIIATGWDGPYMVTEWGPTGHWECLQTPWKSSIEETSSEKAAVYKTRYEYGIEKDKAKCLGSYVFLWGQKQERTPTWYGLFTENGEESEVINVIQYLWTGAWPSNKAPHIYSLQLDKHKANDNIYLKPGMAFPVSAVVTDPENDKLTYRWEILPEPVKLSQGGDHEEKAMPVKNAFSNRRDNGTVTMLAPLTEGAYRVFVYATDGHNNVATANIPFYIKKD